MKINIAYPAIKTETLFSVLGDIMDLRTYLCYLSEAALGCFATLTVYFAILRFLSPDHRKFDLKTNGSATKSNTRFFRNVTNGKKSGIKYFNIKYTYILNTLKFWNFKRLQGINNHFRYPWISRLNIELNYFGFLPDYF